MSLTKKLSLATLIIVMITGVSACNKKPPITTDPSTAEMMGADTRSPQKMIGQGRDNSKQAASGNATGSAAIRVDAAADVIEAKAAVTVGSTKDALAAKP